MFRGLWEPAEAGGVLEGWALVEAQLEVDTAPVECYSFLQGESVDELLVGRLI